MARPAAEPVPAGSLERFRIATVHRSKLQGAEYNPRRISATQKRKLRAGIEAHGMLAPAVIWNATTGRIVGGHQRVSQMDDLYGTQDYELTVAQVELDERAERQANILLNNWEAQGDWDLDKLETLFSSDGGFDLAKAPEATGFDTADLYRLFGSDPVAESTSQQLENLADKVRETRANYDHLVARSVTRDGSLYYLLVVFEDNDELVDFCEHLGLEPVREQSGRVLRSMFDEAKGAKST